VAYNHIEKFIVLCKSPKVRIWEYTYPKPRYVYWLLTRFDNEGPTGYEAMYPDGFESEKQKAELKKMHDEYHQSNNLPPTGEYDTIEELIDAAYSHIDPLLDINND
jgi:hypothetical protein